MQEGTINRVFRSSFPDFERTNFRTNAWRFGVPEHAEELRPYHATTLHALASAAKLEAEMGITLLPDKRGGESHHISYRELYHRATYQCAALEACGVKPGDRVLIVLPTSLDFISIYFAVQFMGAVAVPTYPPAGLRMKAGLERLGHVATHAGVRLCVTSEQLAPVMGELALRAKCVEDIVTVEALGRGAKPEGKFRAHAADPAFIQYTSGSTGNPKGVLLTHSNLVHNIHCSGQAMRINRKDVMVSWCPLYHDMGLIGGLLYPIYWRIPLVLMSPLAFLSRPVRWLEAISDHRGTISPAPNFGYSMCVSRVKEEERAGLDLSSWRLALNGAEPVNYRSIVDFHKIYGPLGFPENAFLPVYGLAEGTLAAAFPRPGDPVRYEVVDRQELANGRAVLASGKGSIAVVSCGKKMPGHELIVVDEEGQPLPEREVGHIVVGGPSVMEGYYGDPEATAAIVRDGWLWTGDLGYIADDQLYVTGRAKDLIIVRGKNLYAEDLERQAERIDGVRPSGVVAFGVYDEEQQRDLVVIVAETKIAGEAARADLAEQIGSRVGEFCDVVVDEVLLVGPGTIPKTSSGKRQRSLCRDQYLRGELAPAKLGAVALGMVFARSKAGMLLMKAKGLLRRDKRRAPE